MTETFRPAELFEGKLDEALLAPPLAEVIGDEIPTRIAIPFKSDDARILSGVWEANPGLSRWEFLDRGESIHVLEGRMGWIYPRFPVLALVAPLTATTWSMPV